MVRIPDEDEHRRRWAALSVGERREVMRAVNRGAVLDDRPQAILAVGVARKQRRFWSRAWLIGPLVSLLFLSQGVVPFLANAGLATLILGGMSWFWYRRAAQAERANLTALGLSPDAASRGAVDEPPSDAPDRAGTPHAANPPKPSRRKRRRR